MIDETEIQINLFNWKNEIQKIDQDLSINSSIDSSFFHSSGHRKPEKNRSLSKKIFPIFSVDRREREHRSKFEQDELNFLN